MQPTLQNTAHYRWIMATQQHQQLQVELCYSIRQSIKLWSRRSSARNPSCRIVVLPTWNGAPAPFFISFFLCVYVIIIIYWMCFKAVNGNGVGQSYGDRAHSDAPNARLEPEASAILKLSQFLSMSGKKSLWHRDSTELWLNNFKSIFGSIWKGVSGSATAALRIGRWVAEPDRRSRGSPTS